MQSTHKNPNDVTSLHTAIPHAAPLHAAPLATPVSSPPSVPQGAAPAAAVPRKSERGEGVISTAVAVLIVAFLGIALWTGFNSMMSTATSRTRTQVEQIGR